MKKLILIFSVLLFQLNYSFANDKVIESLKEGGKLIFIRHALAPGNGDPENFELQNCSTQRNLNEIGIQQSKKIGLIFKKKHFPKWNKTHAWVPTPVILKKNICRVFYAGRDEKNLSKIGSFDINLSRPKKILNVSSSPVLSLGKITGITAKLYLLAKSKSL